MKEIRAIVRPNRLPLLREALRGIPNFPGLTLIKADGFTAPAAVGKRTVREELTDYTPKVMVTVLVDDDMVEEIDQASYGWKPPVRQPCSPGGILPLPWCR